MTEHHGHGHADAHSHGTMTRTYLIVALALAIITAAEVWIYYTPFAKSSAFVPTLLTLSVIKFFTVVGFYMHLKYDHKLFRVLFIGPFFIALGTIIALIFLFSHRAV